MVMINPPGSRPGISSLAITPTTRPIRIVPMMCIGYLGFGGFLGFLLQVFLVVIIGRFLWRMFMRNRQPALAGGPGMFSRDGAPGMMGGMMGGGSASPQPAGGQVPITISPG